MKEEEKDLVADGKKMGLEIRIFHPNFRMGGSEGDYDTALQ